MLTADALQNFLAFILPSINANMDVLKREIKTETAVGNHVFKNWGVFDGMRALLIAALGLWYLPFGAVINLIVIPLVWLRLSWRMNCPLHRLCPQNFEKCIGRASRITNELTSRPNKFHLE